MTWRTDSARIIAKILEDHPDAPDEMLEGLIRAAYPFGLRRYHPYKIWLSEKKAQLDRKHQKAHLAQRWAEYVAKMKGGAE